MENVPVIGWIVGIITIIVIGVIALRRRVSVEGFKLKLLGVSIEAENLKIDS